MGIIHDIGTWAVRISFFTIALGLVFSPSERKFRTQYYFTISSRGRAAFWPFENLQFSR